MQPSAPAGNFKNTAPSSSSSSPFKPPCAACRHQRKQCPPDCILAPYFPPKGPPKDFENARKLFGLSNILQTLKKIPDLKERDEVARSMVYQANARHADPVGGCQHIVVLLKNEIAKSEMELHSLMNQIAYYRNQELAASSSLYSINLVAPLPMYDQPLPIQQYGGHQMYGLENQELVQDQELVHDQELVQDQETETGTAGLGIASGGEAESPTSSQESISDFGGVKYANVESMFDGYYERNKTVSLEFQDPTNYSKRTGD